MLSKGKQPIPLINFVGVQLETALGQLEGLGLNPDDVTVTDEYSDKPVGEIIRQTPTRARKSSPATRSPSWSARGRRTAERLEPAVPP